jgi:UPF0042 nucleotide-binding protein
MPKKSSRADKQAPLVVITGLSGSGMSSATNAFEDLGYFCVDNLPLTMLRTFARLLQPNAESAKAIERAALVINIRERHFLADFPTEVDRLRKRGPEPMIVFFEASDEVLRIRFSETRRPHPADSGQGIRKAIKAERRALQHIRSMSDLIIDTSDLTVHSLRRLLLERFDSSNKSSPLRVQILSFGHKFGNPRDLDLMFDVRHLPNPYFEPALRELTGEDPTVIKYLKTHTDVSETIKKFHDVMAYLLPFYAREGKSYLTVGIGCTGGRHRSVMVTNELKKLLKKDGFNVSAAHRDVQK